MTINQDKRCLNKPVRCLRTPAAIDHREQSFYNQVGDDGMSKKVFVKVLVDFSSFGEMVSVSVTWPDGRVYQVDRVLE